jgi:hypothetical protein
MEQANLSEMENKILSRRKALEASLQTVNYKIVNLKRFFSKEQIRCWYVERKKYCDQLKGLPTVEQVKSDAKKLTARIKEMRKPVGKWAGVLLLFLCSCSPGIYWDQTRNTGIEKYHYKSPGWPYDHKCSAYFTTQPVKHSTWRTLHYWKPTKQ